MPEPEPGQEEQTRALELTGPRDTLPQDPSGSVAVPDFPVVRRGYDRPAVDAYVQRVVKLVDELMSVRSPRAAVREALERVGAETTGILAQAHATADDVTASSRRDAEELTRSSRREAEERLERARGEAVEIVRDAQERTQALDRDADVIWQDRARLLADVNRIAADLHRVVHTAQERFPPEAEVETAEEVPDAPATREMPAVPPEEPPAEPDVPPAPSANPPDVPPGPPPAPSA